MKLLHTSDWHLGKSLYEFSLQPDQEHMIHQLLSLLESHRIDGVLLAGDIYDRPVPPIWALQLFDHFLSHATQKLGIPVLAVAGNHDSGARLEFGSSLYRSGGYYICGHLEKTPVSVSLQDAHGPVVVTLVPYLHPADVRALYPGEEVKTFDSAYHTLLGGLEVDPSLRNIAVGHGFFSNLEAGQPHRPLLTSDSEISLGGMDLAGADCFSAFDYTALGHLHAPQWVREDRIRYSGSPLKYSLSEENQRKCLTVVSLEEKGKVSADTLSFAPLRDVRTVQGEFDRLLDPAYHTNHSFGDYVFAAVEGEEVPYPMEKLRALFPNLLGLQFSAGLGGDVPTAPTAGQRSARLSTQELFLRFYSQVKGESISTSQLALLEEIISELEQEEDAL